MPPPRHQNPARSGASRDIDAGCNALNSDSEYSSRAAWHAAPPDIVNPSTERRPHLLPRCVRGAAGKDSAKEIREYFVPDFSNWKDHDAQKALDRLLRDLKADGRRQTV